VKFFLRIAWSFFVATKAVMRHYRLTRDAPAFSDLHRAVKNGDLRRVRMLLASQAAEQKIDVNAYDREGKTPVMHAVESPRASVELVRLLLEHGADIHQKSRAPLPFPESVVALAVSGGDPLKVELLVRAGANLRYKGSANYNAVIDAVHSRDVMSDARLIDLLKLLIAHGVELNAVTSYAESGLRVLSNIGRFDAVRVLLEAGADAAQLKWTPLMRAVAISTLDEVKRLVEGGAALEEKDWWERTAWLIAIQTGTLAKAQYLLERGADRNARGRCGKPPLFYAIQSRNAPMLRWLLQIGIDPEQTDQFESTPLMEAAEHDNPEALEELLRAGADVGRAKSDGQIALSYARTREIAARLLAAGADPRELPFEARRALLGFDPEPDEAPLADVSPAEFRSGRERRFGSRNPEELRDPFCESMIRAGTTAFSAAQLFKGKVKESEGPIWCAQRFGQSITFLPDGRTVQIGGEHEDSYDQDFCIYNDVFVHHPDGTIRIYGYPESDFPPTDFHTATLIGRHIYVIGSLGYCGKRRYDKTPVYRLDTDSLRMEELKTSGQGPGWIYKHRAVQPASHQIRVFGGTVVTAGEKEAHTRNDRSFTLDIENLRWSADSPTGGG
jgi:ankyrin repeat protein